MKLTGTLIKNFFHCKRQAYLYHEGLNFRNDLMRIGEIMHEEQEAKDYVFEKIKVDDIKDGILLEYKKSSSNAEGTRMQVIYYLDFFRKKGLELKGKIIDLSKNAQFTIELNNEETADLEKFKRDIKAVLNGPMPGRLERKACRGCSFFDYCWTE